MSGILMMVIAIVVLGGAYLLYGRYLQNKRGIDPKAKTPAYELEDGVDYVPADTNVVFGHQFASIAGAGPINGPIQAFRMASCFTLDSDGIYDGSNIYSTWYDNYKTFRSSVHNRPGYGKYLTAHFCDITIDTWCTGSNSGC